MPIKNYSRKAEQKLEVVKYPIYFPKIFRSIPDSLIPGTPKNPKISPNFRGKWVGFYGN